MRKKKGSTMISTLIFGFLALMLILTIILGFAEMARSTVASAELDYISNNYILKLETFGYLSQTDLANLKAELEASGFTDISFSDTTTTKQSYSSRIKLRIVGKYYTNFAYEGKKDTDVHYVDIDFERYTISKS